jgi:hypothetical protein
VNPCLVEPLAQPVLHILLPLSAALREVAPLLHSHPPTHSGAHPVELVLTLIGESALLALCMLEDLDGNSVELALLSDGDGAVEGALQLLPTHRSCAVRCHLAVILPINLVLT